MLLPRTRHSGWEHGASGDALSRFGSSDLLDVPACLLQAWMTHTDTFPCCRRHRFQGGRGGRGLPLLSQTPNSFEVWGRSFMVVRKNQPCPSASTQSTTPKRKKTLCFRVEFDADFHISQAEAKLYAPRGSCVWHMKTARAASGGCFPPMKDNIVTLNVRGTTFTSLWRQPGNTTHVVVARRHEAPEHGLLIGVVFCVGGWKSWQTDRCSNKDVCKGDRETWTGPLVNEQARRQN